MNRLMIFACAGTGLFFAGLAWVLALVPGAPTTISADMLSRSVGVALLGFVLIATGTVFRSAVRAEQKPAATKSGPHASEYRSGFGEHAVPTQARPRRRDTVRSLRRAVVEHGQGPVPVGMDSRLAMAEIERLQSVLHRRAAQMTARNNRGDIQKHDPASRQ